jgi:hypothetical protein
MNTLLDLEPREAGTHELEPIISFDEAGVAMQDRNRCAGCCVNSTEEIIATHSVTQ